MPSSAVTAPISSGLLEWTSQGDLESIFGSNVLWRKVGDAQTRAEQICLNCSLGDSNPCFRRERARWINGRKRRQLAKSLFFNILVTAANGGRLTRHPDLWSM